MDNIHTRFAANLQKFRKQSGLTQEELAQKLGIKLCSMGERIFRCETAPLAALVAVMYETGNM